MGHHFNLSAGEFNLDFVNVIQLLQYLKIFFVLNKTYPVTITPSQGQEIVSPEVLQNHLHLLTRSSAGSADHLDVRYTVLQFIATFPLSSRFLFQLFGFHLFIPVSLQCTDSKRPPRSQTQKFSVTLNI